MSTNEIETDPELRQVLWACYKFWQGVEGSPHEKEIWYGWVVGLYEKKFGTRFHPSKLRVLANLGFLKPGDTARGGSRRYYMIINPDQIEKLLTKWGMG